MSFEVWLIQQLFHKLSSTPRKIQTRFHVLKDAGRSHCLNILPNPCVHLRDIDFTALSLILHKGGSYNPSSSFFTEVQIVKILATHSLNPVMDVIFLRKFRTTFSYIIYQLLGFFGLKYRILARKIQEQIINVQRPQKISLL